MTETAQLCPDREGLASFCHAMFKHAQPNGVVSLRAFKDNGADSHAIFVDPVNVGHPDFIEIVFERARQAAFWHEPAVFCPPVMTFRDGKNAKTENILEGVALSVECDCTPTEALETLRGILGEPTIVSASGGEWENPETGEVERKLHLHWRLQNPTRDIASHTLLREARDIATKLVGGDPSAVPLVHPLRWPGSWHRKKTPRISEIVGLSENEIDLLCALRSLRDAFGSTNTGQQQSSNPKNLKADNPDDIAAALRVIPNDDLDWKTWNEIGMATWNASGGSDVGRKAFAEWSSKSSKNDPHATNLRWDHYATSPPDRIGFGTLVYLARRYCPGWTTADTAQDMVEPIDLWAKFDPPSLPRGILPDIIERFAIDQGRAMGADIAGVAVGALAVCAAAIPDKIQLQVKKHNTAWLESARLWVALVGPPSTMKSPIMSAVVRPLRRIDSDMARRFSDELARIDKLPSDERKQAERPKQTRLVLQDTTIEAAQEIIKDSPDGLLCYQDEMSGWFGSMDKYSGSKGSAKDRAFWLEAYNGATYSVNRIGRGSVFIENLSVSILGGIQPEPIRKLAEDSADDGLLQRLLPVLLQPAVLGADEPPSEEVAEYATLISRLHNIENPMMGIGLQSTTLHFDDGAQTIRQDLERKHLDLQGCETINKKLSAHIGKYNGIFARLCVVWHCVENSRGGCPGVISAATARRVATFLHAFLLPHALAFYAGVLGLSDDHDRLTAIAGHILAHKLERITNRDVQRGDRTMRKLERRDIERIFDQLDAFGWITRTPGFRPSDPAHWIVNPAVHQKFANRAKDEAERRRRERATISGIMPKAEAA
jgi:Protein of unknown function (DUF3987)/Primase C terminal 2 (PriCT-2)